MPGWATRRSTVGFTAYVSGTTLVVTSAPEMPGATGRVKLRASSVLGASAAIVSQSFEFSDDPSSQRVLEVEDLGQRPAEA